MHVALIGARGFGRHHLEGLQASPFVEAITLAGRNTGELEPLCAEFGKVRGITTDVSALLADPSVDLVDLVVPHDLHLPLALRALEARKHVIVEKPPARTPAEFRLMVEAAERCDRRLFVVMNLLFSQFHRTVRRVVDSGALGTPFLAVEVSTGTARTTYEDPTSWRADRDRCGGGLQIDGGFHGVYRMLYFLESLGAPVSVLADCDQIGVSAPTKGEDFSALTLAYPGGARIHLMNAWTARAPLGPIPSGILGTEGTLVFTGDRSRPLLLRRPGQEDPVPVMAGPEGFAATVAACVEHYIQCLATGQQPAAGTDLAALTLEIITSAYQSAREGRRVPLEGCFSTRFEA